MAKTILCILVPGFEEIETIAPIDLLRRAGATVTIASLTGEKLVAGRCNITIQAEVALAEVTAPDFDMLLLPGGPGVKALRADGRPAQLAKAYAQAGKPVAAICAAPTVLADAGLLAGKRFTAHFSVHGELPQVLANERVVVDGNLITSRGAGTAVDFGLALVRHLFGDTAAQEVAKAIMV
jgi:4-methyl-5(b-hydroxyethyl)-thiazole monophosphate biosynthesis